MKRGGLSFATRLNLWFAAVVLGLSIILFLLAYYLLYQAVVARDRSLLQAQLDLYRAWYTQGGLQALSERFENQASSRETYFVRVVGPGGAALFMSVPARAAGLDLSALEDESVTGAVKWLALPTDDKGDQWLAASTRLPDGAWLQVGKTTDAQTALLAQFRKIFGWVVLSALALGTAGGALITRRALRPIHQLIETVQGLIATGRINARMPLPEANDEISRLARLFNTMLEKNDALIRGMREALDNVAHELRTPLTRLRGSAELALQGDPDAQKERDALLDSLEETDRVLTMLNTLMDISEAETGLMKLERRSISLGALVGEVLELFEFVAEEKQIRLTTEIPGDLQVFADPHRLRQVLVNLVDNGLKYTPNGGRVSISARASGNETVIAVQDNGAGIPQEEVERIWERLYRGDKSRSQRGLGLGLSLVKAIVGAHGGRIELQSEVGKGSTFSIHLPATAV